MPETYYQSAHTGKTIDDAISRIASGEFDKLADDAVAAGASAQNAAVSAQQAKTSSESAARRAEAARDAVEVDETKLSQAVASAAESERKAKLYADQTEASVSGVASFNGRGGHVMPQSGDYTAQMVGAMENKGWLSGYSTVLAAATLPSKAGYSFFAVSDGGALMNAADAPFGKVETQYFVLVDNAQSSRRSVQAFRFGSGEVATRDIFDGSWLTDWVYCATTDKVVPLDGSKNMTGTLTVDNPSKKAAVTKNRTVSDGTQYQSTFGISEDAPSKPYVVIDIKDVTNGGSNWGIGVSAKEQKPIFYEYVGGIFSVRDIHHTGNKPSGSYTGNGSAVERKINTDGLGDAAMLFDANGSVLAICGVNGAIYKNAAVGTGVLSADRSEVKFANGVLTLATANGAFNYSGITYHYQVL